MGIITRLLLLLYALCIGAASLVAAAVCLKLIPGHLWKNELMFALGQMETLGVLAVIFLVSLYMLSASVSSSGPKKEKLPAELELKSGDSGTIRVSVEAVKRLAERVASSIHGVRETHVKLLPPKDGEAAVTLTMDLVLLQGISVPDIGQQAAQAVRQELENTMSMTDLKVDVSVSDITNAPVDKKRVV